MTYSLSVDPGRAGLAWAVCYNGRLLDAGLCRGPKGPRDFSQAPIQVVAANALKTVPPYPYTLGSVERMRHYPGVSKSNPNDLLDLQAIGGLVLGALVPPAQVVYFTSQEWMGGSLPHSTVSFRVSQRLRGEELEVYAKALGRLSRIASLRHNVVDAVGQALHLHGRFHRDAA